MRLPKIKRITSGKSSILRVACEALERRMLLALAPVGPEFRVNTHTTLTQADAVIASDADGDFVVTWRSRDQDGSLYGIYAQRYNSAGVAQGGEFRVNTTTAANQTSPAIAMDADGDFVISWESAGQDSGTYGVYFQRYNAAGVAQGVETRANTFTPNHQIRPTLAMDDAGNFVVAWQSNGQDGDGYGIYAQRYNTAGVAQGSEFRVNNDTVHSQQFAKAAMDATGDFVVTWQDMDIFMSSTGIYAQRFNSAGVAQGGLFRVNTFTTNRQENPSIAMDDDGDFTVAWHSFTQDGDGWGVYAQRFNAAGSTQGGEFRVNTYTTSHQTYPSVGMDDAGNLTILWQSALQDGDGYGIYGQRYTPGGAAEGSEFHVSSYTTSGQTLVNIAVDSDGDFVAAWHSSLQDGSGSGIYAQRFDSFDPVPAVPVGPEFRVNTTTTGFQGRSHIAADAAGNFVVTWASPQSGDAIAVYAQRYDASGTALGSEFKVNTTTSTNTNNTVRSRVAMDDDGDFVIVWSATESNYPSSDVHVRAQRYNAAGVPQGTEAFLAGATGQSSVAMRPHSGEYIVVWEKQSAAAAVDIIAQRYFADGIPEGLPIVVGSSSTFNALPRVAIADNLEFVVVWTDLSVFARRLNAVGTPLGPAFEVAPGSQFGEVSIDATGDFAVAYTLGGEVFARQYYASGDARGPGVQLNQYATDAQSLPRISSNGVGEFLVSWNSVGQDGDLSGVYARRFDRYGGAMGDEFRVNTHTTSDQLTSQGVLLDNGDFVIQWSSNLQDGSLFGVYAQRFTDEPVAPAVNASQFSFDVAPHRLTFTFSQDVSASLGTNDVLLENLTSSTTIPSSDLSLSYDTGTNTATFTYTGNASGIGGVLPDGNYRATLIAAGITNPQGVPLPANHILNFFFLNGDANHDGRANLNDFNILAANFGQSPRNFAQGDFNYDTIVNLNDFNILASRFGQVLAAPNGGSGLFGGKGISVARDDWFGELLS